MDSVGKRNHVLIGGPHPPTKGKRNFVQHDDSTMNIVVVISRPIIIFMSRFCNAVDCRFELALEVQWWTRARSECLPGAQNYSYATDRATHGKDDNTEKKINEEWTCSVGDMLADRRTHTLLRFRGGAEVTKQ